MAEERKVLQHTADEIDAAVEKALDGTFATNTDLQKKVNPNILDNWYFGNPVNQREFSGENTSGSYFIDRWLSYNCSYANGIIKIKKGMHDGTQNGYIIQRIDSHFSDKLNGMVCTFSALVNDSLISGTAVYSNTSEVTYTNKNGVRLYTQIANGLVEVVALTNETTEKTISAVKLELGDQQTLAHQENGVWVLNEIPDYGEQLALCQRRQHFFNPSGKLYSMIGNGEAYRSDMIIVNFTLPTSMAEDGTPILENLDISKIQLRGAGQNLTPTSVSIDGASHGSSFSIMCAVSGATAGAAYDMILFDYNNLGITNNL